MASRRGLMGGMLLAAALQPAPLMAQPAPQLQRVAVLATIGAMRPSHAGVRGLYPGAFIPVTIEVDVRVLSRFFVFGSGQFAGKDGEVVFDLPPAPVEHFPLRLRTAAVRVGAGVGFPVQRWLVSGQAGLSVTRYEEEWAAEEIPAATGRAWGFIAGGGVGYRVFGRVWAVGRVEYSYTPIDEVRQTVPTFDLSGLSVSGGIAISF